MAEPVTALCITTMDVHEGELIQICNYSQLYSIIFNYGKAWSMLMDMASIDNLF